MKMKLRHCLGILSFALVAPAAGQIFSPTGGPEAAPPPPFGPVEKPDAFAGTPQVTVDVLMVSLPEAKALAMLPQLRDPVRVAAAQEQLLALIARKEAQLIDWPELTAHSDVTATSETIVEQRYPIEFEQPTEPGWGNPPKRKLSPDEDVLRKLRLAGALVPMTFETRNTGQTLQMTATISADRKSATISVSATIVRLSRMAQFSTVPIDADNHLSVAQPVFTTHKTSLILSLRDGERRLIYVGKHTETPDQIHLWVLGLRILPPLVSEK
jgi:hypothetical protein